MIIIIITGIGLCIKKIKVLFRSKIKCRLKAGNSCYYSIQTLLSSRLLQRSLKIKLYKTTILTVMLHGYETWSLTLRVFESRILTRIFGPKWDENGEWRRLHNEELHLFYRSPCVVRVIKSKRLRWAGHIARMEEGRSAFKI